MKKVFYIEAVCSIAKETSDEPEDERYYFPRLSYDFYDIDLQSLVLLAKTDADAMDEYLIRIHGLLRENVKKTLQKNPFLDEDEVYRGLQETAVKAVYLYDQTKGPFLNFVRRVLMFSRTDICQKEIIRYVRELKHYGHKIRIVYENEALYDSVSEDDKESILLRLDLEKFIEGLNPEKRKIFVYYLNGFTAKQISQFMEISYSTVNYDIKVLIERFRQMERMKK